MENERIVSLIKPIDLKELVLEKNPKLAARIPGFVYGLLNRLLHIREVNEIIRKYGHLKGVPFIEAVLQYFEVKVEHYGDENFPSTGRFIFASNHPLGGFDGLMLIKVVSDRMGKSLFLVRDELTKIPTLTDLFIPINKFGDQRRSASLINEAYNSESQILIFPSGLASRKIKGKITDLVWQKHFIQKSVEHRRDVVPVYISGRNSWFFYWLANFRKLIGIKLNIEMFLLPDELFKNRGKTFVINFGIPLSWNSFDRTRTQTEWAEEVKKVVYALASQP
ncbi:MAG: 1-acyl-sn-glycerol-3-phosphate acyltransferase [Mariniphaga sp.]